MVNFDQLMEIFSTPRPNGSEAEVQTRRAVGLWLTENGIRYSVHAFRHYPYFFESIGLWILLSRSLLALAIWLRLGWLALPIAILGTLGGLVDVALHLPVVSFPGVRRGENILVEFDPRATPAVSGEMGRVVESTNFSGMQEIIISAHYDSKTEPLDHRQRMFFLKSVPFGIALTLVLGVAGPIEAFLSARGSPLADSIYLMATILVAPLLILTWGLGLNLVLGRFRPQSQGAVDNGTACAILLGLAHRLKHGEIGLRRTRVTLALFTGEEVNMQGSRAYVKSRDWPLPSAAVNLEAMAQDGDYVYWERDGSIFNLQPTSRRLNRYLSEVVSQVTGTAPIPAGPVLSDGASFMAAGLPTAVLGTYDKHWRDTGFHQPSDNLGRVKMDRLPEGVEILVQLLKKIDCEQSCLNL